MTAPPNIVLVHGAWADGSSWSAVIEHLQADGYRVTAPQFGLTRLADDVARLRQVLARQDGPTLLDQAPGGPALAHLDVDSQGFAWMPEDDFVNHFAADGDQVIPPDAQRQFAPRMGATTVEVSTNHVAMVSHPDDVLQLIKTAAEAVPAAT
jgi:hypothetical protein